MILNEKNREIIRNHKMEWHCHKIIIQQKNKENGYKLEGYGIIKSQKNGVVYLDFICTSSNIDRMFYGRIPQEMLDESESLSMEATTLDGIKIHSKDFSINIEFQLLKNNNPKKYSIGLRDFTIKENINTPEENTNYLHMEFHEKCNIPFNKCNEIKSSLGFERISRNQATIKHKDFEINFIQHDEYTEVYIKNFNVDPTKLKNSITFYLSFTSGRNFQPYMLYFRNGEFAETKVFSVDKQSTRNSIPLPIEKYVLNQDGSENLDRFHYDLLHKIIESKFNIFESIYSQWSRIFYSLDSPESSVPMLTLSVAIEGILNDIFIPVISITLKNEEFEEEKKKIINQVKSIENTSPEHIKSLTNFINKWGNIHAKKALKFLEEKNVIESFQVKSWEKLRNSSAHPKLLAQDRKRKAKNEERTMVCLGLFYRLILNAYSYEGAQYIYKESNESTLLTLPHVDILNLNESYSSSTTPPPATPPPQTAQ